MCRIGNSSLLFVTALVIHTEILAAHTITNVFSLCIPEVIPTTVKWKPLWPYGGRCGPEKNTRIKLLLDDVNSGNESPQKRPINVGRWRTE